MSDIDFTPPESSEPQSVNDVDLGAYLDQASAPEPEPTPEPAPAIDNPVDEFGVPATQEQAQVEIDPFQDFGGRQNVEQALKLWEAVATEDGVVQVFIEAGRSLGLTPEQMQGLFGEVQEIEQPDPDAPLTRAEWEAWQRQQQEAVQVQQYQQAVQQVRAEASQAVHKAVGEIGLDMENPATQYVLQLGDKYLDKSTPPSPEAVRNAVQRGWADYQVLTQQAQQQYVNTKRTQAASVPGAPSGASAPSSSADPEPKNVAEASERFWKSLGL